eukprot:TRINITY_DN7088_c0_g2_i1.p1 TRINITY_DN7088_c0_g2~~TRINITY_DN7088_c0_g2_i1.p1  ORF type:complete len:267 (+),score=18.21 TRINITY_DN7088_c0_g2_i1:34-834(+)
MIRSLICRGGMPRPARNMFECELHTLAGSVFTFMVQYDWNVETLKERVEWETKFPRFLQVLSTSDRKLLNTDELRDVFDAQGFSDGRLCLCLAFLDVPDQLQRADVQRAWDAFCIRSTDCGDTIPQSKLLEVIRYVDTGANSCQVEDVLVDHERVSFTDVLSVIATIKDASATVKHAPEELEEFVSERYPFAKSDFPRRSSLLLATWNAWSMERPSRRRSRRGRRTRARSAAPAQGASSRSGSRIEPRAESVRGIIRSSHAFRLSL